MFVVLAVALFALIVGGFFWPRPQMRRGPWVPADSTAPDSTAPTETGYLRPR